MAIIRLGPIVSGISGTVGSVVFVAAGRSTVARPRPITRQKTSPFLARSKSRMKNLRNFWSTLTTLQKDLWQTAAADINRTNALGQSSPMNGYQYFIMTNKVAFPGPFQTVTEPQTLVSADLPSLLIVAFGVSSVFNVTVTNPFQPLPLTMQVYGWPFWRTTESRELARLVFIEEKTSSGPVVDLDVLPEWTEHFGTMTEGQRFAVGVKTRTTASPFVPMTIIRDTFGA